MINKMVTKEINYLNNKIYKLEEYLDYWKKASFHWCDKCDRLEDCNDHLKAELTYWKETAEYWQDVAVEFEFGRHNKYKNEAKELEKPKYQTSISEELKNTIEKVNKTLDKQKH